MTLYLKTQELNIEKAHTQRSVRQWKKDVKSKYAPLLEQKGRLAKVLEESEKQFETKNLELKFAKEEQVRHETQQQLRKRTLGSKNTRRAKDDRKEVGDGKSG